MSSNGGEANFSSSKVSKKWSIFKEESFFSKEENLDHIDKSNVSLFQM